MLYLISQNWNYDVSKNITYECRGDPIMDIINGKIIIFDDCTNEERSYEIEQITAEFEEDIPDVIGVVRCTGMTLESDAPSEINLAAEEELYKELADVEYNDADGEGRYRKNAAKAISKRTGVDLSRIKVE